MHQLVNRRGNDFELLLTIGVILANECRKVELLPELNEKDLDFRNKILPGVRMNKNPDLRIDGEYWEVEAPQWPYTRTKIDNRIRQGQEQADALIIHFAKAVNINSVERAIRGRFQIHQKFKKAEIWMNYKRIGTYTK